MNDLMGLLGSVMGNTGDLRGILDPLGLLGGVSSKNSPAGPAAGSDPTRSQPQQATAKSGGASAEASNPISGLLSALPALLTLL